MKIKKLLTPILATVGATAVAAPLVCLTSCGNEIQTLKLFELNQGEKEVNLNNQPIGTQTYKFVLAYGAPQASSVETTVVLQSASDNINIVQCTSSLDFNILTVNVDYWCKRGVTGNHQTTFNMKFLCKVGTGKETVTYQQIETGFVYSINSNN